MQNILHWLLFVQYIEVSKVTLGLFFHSFFTTALGHRWEQTCVISTISMWLVRPLYVLYLFKTHIVIIYYLAIQSIHCLQLPEYMTLIYTSVLFHMWVQLLRILFLGLVLLSEERWELSGLRLWIAKLGWITNSTAAWHYLGRPLTAPTCTETVLTAFSSLLELHFIIHKNTQQREESNLHVV